MTRSSNAAKVGAVGAAMLLIAASALTQATAIFAATPAHLAPLGITVGDQSVMSGSRGGVNVRTLLAREASNRPSAPSSGRQASQGISHPSTTLGGPSAVRPDVAPAPDPVTDSGAPAPSTPVAVAGQSEPGSGVVEPATPGIAAGADEIVQVDNNSLRFSDRTGGTSSTLDLPTFFALPEPPSGPPFTRFTSSPEVHFDTLRQRWIASEVSWNCEILTYPGDPANDGHGYIDYAISQTADPQGSWTTGFFEWNDLFPARPEFGTSTDKFALTANLFAMGGAGSGTDPGCNGGAFNRSEAIVMDWTQLGPHFVGSNITFRPFQANAPDFRFAIQEPLITPDLEAILPSDATSSPGIQWARFNGSAVKNTISISGFDLTADGIVPQLMQPPNPQQPGGTLTTAIDAEPDSVIDHNGALAFTSTYPCIPTGDSSTRDCVRVVILHEGTLAEPTRIGDTLIGTNGFDDSFGGIGWSGNGELHVVYTRSSASSDASSYDSYHAAPDAWSAWSAPQVLSSGSSAYAGSTWAGDPTISTDPQDPASVWVGDAYAGGGGKWATKIHQVTVGGAGTKFNPIAPVRVVDLGIASGSPHSFPVAGTNGIPVDAVAITGNLTVAGQTGAGYVSLGATATNNPSSSTLNFPVGDVRANNVTVALAADGSLSAVYEASGGRSTRLVLDVTGYFRSSTGDRYQPVAPSRILDSRTDPTIHSFVANIPQSFQVRGDALTDPTILTIPADATAITANLTVTGQTRAGYVSITPNPVATPGTSTINFPLKDVRANGLTVPIAADGTVAAVFKGAPGGKVDLVVDVTGYYTGAGPGLLFYPLNPGRRVDTRLALGVAGLGNGLNGVQSTTPRSTVVAGHDAVPATAVAITGNLTVTGQTAAGRIALTDVSDAAPMTSTINFPLGDSRANGVTVPLGSGTGLLWFVYQGSTGKGTQLILDITGYFQ